VKSYDIVEWGKPLQLVIRETPTPRGQEVRVRITACGVCHSDLHIREGALDLGNGRRVSFESIGVRLPFTLGHEIVGVVDAAGPASAARVGTACVVYPWHGCGECERCARGDELSCEAGRALGTRRPGGYSDYVMVPHERYLLDYGRLEPRLAATCACSGLTAYSAWRKMPALDSTDTVLLIGAGGLGLSALSLARELSQARVIMADVDASKLENARKLGAQVLDLSRNTSAEELRTRLGQGVRGVIDFVGTPATLEFSMKVIGRGGTVIVVGLFGGAVTLSTALLPMRNLTLRGSYVGTLEEMRELLSLMQNKGTLNVPLDSHPMSEINDVLADLAQGRVTGRAIVIPAPG
jgi:D-arabinose 1-dehydrogenase-like Zn-dependent alcohol dehydrogenase